MKYQSELIKEIIDTRGHKKSSLHYESECVESWIEETKGAYPKLCDYQSEWLNYINENPLGEFPYETVTDVTDATVNNVVPYDYKSAILKGHTLVNLSTFKNNSVTQSSSSGYISISDITQIKPSTDYTFIYYVTFSNITSVGKNIESIDYLDSYFPKLRLTETQANGSYILKFKQTSKDDISNSKQLGLKFVTLSGTATIEKAIIIEGDYTNIDIPYFEGMQSVKMPVLTTTGNNLWNGKWYKGFSNNGGGGELATLDDLRTTYRTDYIKIPKNTDKVYAHRFCEATDYTGTSVHFGFFDKDKQLLVVEGGLSPASWSVPTNTEYVVVHVWNSVPYDFTTLRVNVSDAPVNATSYEPYKSNILTVNEDVTLRSNGNICDELNLLTGQLTQRIDEDGEVLSQEVVKTVDLNIQDQDGNTLRKIKPIEGTMRIHSDGTPLNPTITMEIPVEATTQNLYSFIEEE